MSTEDKLMALESLIRDEQSNADIHRPHSGEVGWWIHEALHQKHLNRVKVLLEARDALQTVETVKGVMPI